MHRARVLAVTATIVAVLSIDGRASAQGRQDVHDGFYARLGGGLGLVLIAGEGGGGTDYSTTGFALPFEAKLGFAIIPNLILGGTVTLTPQVAGGGEIDGGVDIDDVTAFAWYTGPAVTYYFMPINLYIGGSLGFGQGSAEGDLQVLGFGGTFDVESDIGFGFNATVGKQWLLGERFGIGVAGLFQFLTLPPDTGDADNANVFLFSVMASFSYN